MIISDLILVLKDVAVKRRQYLFGCKDNYFFKESVIYFSYICFAR